MNFIVIDVMHFLVIGVWGLDLSFNVNLVQFCPLSFLY
jgi:hypothetical protein